MDEVSKYLLKLKNKEEVAHKTWAFHFEKPDGFSFVPGQTMRLICPESDEGRILTILNAPHEEDLVFATRMRGSAFKQFLSKLKVGERMEVEGPFGQRFVLHDDPKIPAVFIAGGIGITPPLSILSHVMHKGLSYHITLFYSNKRERDIAFLDKLNGITSKNENIHLILTLTQELPSDWKGETGRVDADMIKRYVPDIQTPFFYIAGPPMMVVSMKDILEKAGVPADHILTKKFTGY